MNPQSAQDLINMGFYGYQGWDDAGALADYRATGGAGKGAATNTVQSSGNTTGGGGGNNYLQAAIGAANQGISDVKSQYSDILNTLRNRSDTSVAAEFGKRGIPTSSGVVGEAQNKAFSDLSANVLSSQSSALSPFYQSLINANLNAYDLQQQAALQQKALNAQSGGASTSSLESLYGDIFGGGGEQTTTSGGATNALPSNIPYAQANQYQGKSTGNGDNIWYNPTVGKLGIPYNPNAWQEVSKAAVLKNKSSYLPEGYDPSKLTNTPAYVNGQIQGATPLSSQVQGFSGPITSPNTQLYSAGQFFPNAISGTARPTSTSSGVTGVSNYINYPL